MMFKQSTKSKLFYGKTYHSNLKHAALLVCALLASNLFASAAPFKNDDVICFLGDSITHGGRYPFYILDYYATRFPERKITIHNCGISGDTATGGIKRLQWDVIAHKPTVTTIMFGMNDVRRSLYGKKTPDKNNLAGRKRAIDVYKSKMKEITAKLKENNISIIYITPSPYDQTVENKTRNLVGVNDALKECAEFCREQATQNHAGLVEFNQPMTAINAKGQKTNPKFSLIGGDRVHPHSVGHWVMAYLFLKSQQEPALVASIGIDFKDGRLLLQKNCTVSNIRHENGKLSFDCLEKSLPMPVTPAYLKADKLVPLTRELNNETIAFTGLPQGKYTLFIDKQKVISADAAAWSNGINLAVLDTPMQKQAAAVDSLINQKRRAEASLRNIRKMEIQMRNAKVDITDPAAREKYLKDFLAKIQTSRYSRYYTSLVKSYRANKPKENKLLETISKMNAAIYQQNKPRNHHFLLKQNS